MTSGSSPDPTLLIVGFCFLLVFFLLGAGMIFFSLRARKKAQQSQSWPSTAGTVSEVQVKEISREDADGFQTTSYQPQVTYSYQVGNQTYTSDRLSFGARVSYGNRNQASKVLEAYPVGMPLVIYYDPEKPAEAVVERQASGFKLLLIGGILLIVISFCVGCAISGASLVSWMRAL